jgi:dGTPase
MLYPEAGFARRSGISPGEVRGDATYRPNFHRDYARILHSAAFRRLTGKTQLFPTDENDFFRNRLTHSLEVAQVAASVARHINADHEYFKEFNISERLCELASLSHDIGHPPFGHNGEEALNTLMNGAGGFEGNAQTLRILTKLEKKEFVGDIGSQFAKPTKGFEYSDRRIGLDLCARSLAAILKYDAIIPQSRQGHPSIKKGYFHDDRDVVQFIKDRVGSPEEGVPWKTIECSIMDISDDIAYSTYDLEDSFKANFLNPLKMLSVDDKFKEDVAETVRQRAGIYYPEKKQQWENFGTSDVDAILKDVFKLVFQLPEEFVKFTEREPGLDINDITLLASTVYRNSKLWAEDGYFRTSMSSSLVGRFVGGIEVLERGANPIFWNARLKFDDFLCVEVLKRFAFRSLIMASFLRLSEARGTEMLSAIFKTLSNSHGHFMLPRDYREICEYLEDNSLKQRVVCDFIASMTDRYALEFFSRLFSTHPPSIFKPY